MNITSFDDLLRAAKAQPEPQRLLFVFAGAELPLDASDAQREQFAAGEGGEIAPLMCVDKLLSELTHFDALKSEAERAGPPWAIVFATAMSGCAGQTPTSADAVAPLQRMVASIKAGQLAGMLPFNRDGIPVNLA
jgi:hypothetical protein